MIPNTLPNGVRRIEERDYRTGALVYAVTSPNGVWNGVSTVNQTGGFSAPVIMQTPRILVTSPVIADSFCTGEAITIRYNARGVGQVRVELTQNNGGTWEVLGTVTPNTAGSGANTFSWIIPSEIFNPNIRVRVVSVDRPDIIGVSERFTVSARSASCNNRNRRTSASTTTMNWLSLRRVRSVTISGTRTVLPCPVRTVLD